MARSADGPVGIRHGRKERQEDEHLPAGLSSPRRPPKPFHPPINPTHGQKFDALLCACQVPEENDLVTMDKYRESGAVYYAPPLPSAVDVLRERFHVHAVHFGSYGMHEYFPVIVASPLS